MRGRRRLVLTGVSVGVAMVVVIMVLTYLPVSQHFEMDNVFFTDLYTTCSGLYPTPGTAVTFYWWDQTNVSFAVVSCAANSVVYQESGTSGSASFTAHGGFYKFGALCGAGSCSPANVSGSYTGPLLVW